MQFKATPIWSNAMQISEKTKRIGKLVANILSWVVVAFAIGIMIFTIVSVNTFDKDKNSIFGYKFYTVLSNSMSKSENNADMKVHFKAGDVIIVKELSLEEYYNLDSGEIISFLSLKDNKRETVTHMIRERKYDENTGEFIGYVTFGTNTGVNDETAVEPEYILGTYAGKLPYVGTFFQFLRTPAGYVLFILIPFLLIIGYNGYSAIRAFRIYKGEQRAAMDAERAELAKEREETAQMMKELMELKAQLGMGGGAPKETTTEEKPTDGSEK
jgi:signal peptidase